MAVAPIKIIGITGKAGAGKDTLADYLQRQHGFKRIAFADPLRRGLTAMLDLGPEHFDYPIKEQRIAAIGKSPRELMQTLGTEWGRNLIHPDLWLILAGQAIDVQLRAGGRVVMSDVRFENEAALVRSMGGAVWHLSRIAAGTRHQHVSESGIEFVSGIDARFRNDSGIEDLYHLADGVLA